MSIKQWSPIPARIRSYSRSQHCYTVAVQRPCRHALPAPEPVLQEHQAAAAQRLERGSISDRLAASSHVPEQTAPRHLRNRGREGSWRWRWEGTRRHFRSTRRFLVEWCQPRSMNCQYHSWNSPEKSWKRTFENSPKSSVGTVSDLVARHTLS